MKKEDIKYKKTICFCNKQISKSWKCKWFQIIPVENYIDKEVRTNHFPFILEYNYNKNDIVQISQEDFIENDSELFSEISHEYNVMVYILKLLSVVTNHYFFVYNLSDQGWFINLNTKSKEGLKCQYGKNLYLDKQFENKMFISNFSENGFEEIELVEHSTYYTHPDIDNEFKNELTLSKNTEQFFNNLENLTHLQKQHFDSAVTLIYNGLKIRKDMKSLAFLGFVSSIETMAHLEAKINKEEIEFECKSCKTIKSSKYKCNNCGKPIWGISQQIKNHLKKYLTKNENFNKVINKLYGRRSKIAHTGNLLTGDMFFDWNNPEEREKHDMELIEAMQYSKMSLVNYILFQK